MSRIAAAVDRRALERLALAVAFVAALLVATPSHSHSSVGAESACAACSLRHQTPLLDAAPVTVVPGEAVEDAALPTPDVEPTARYESPSRPRSPPVAFPSF